MKLLLGNAELDENRSFGGSWEGVKDMVAYLIPQVNGSTESQSINAVVDFSWAFCMNVLLPQGLDFSSVIAMM